MGKALFDNEELWKQFKNFSENRMPKSKFSEKSLPKIRKITFKNFILKLGTIRSRESLKKPLQNPKQALQNEGASFSYKKMKNKKAEGIEK